MAHPTLARFSEYCSMVVGQIFDMIREAPMLARLAQLKIRSPDAPARPVPDPSRVMAWLERAAPRELPSEALRAARSPKHTLFQRDCYARLRELNALAAPSAAERAQWERWHVQAAYGYSARGFGFSR